MAYSTKIKFNKRSTGSTFRTRRALSRERNYPTKGWRAKLSKFKLSKLKNAKVKRALYTSAGILLTVLIVGLLYGLSYVQSITEDLPSPDAPFGNRDATSEIYDRNGKLLYRVIGDENSDPVDIENVPPLLKWSFLAAEDVDFYKHPGIDVVAIMRCGLRYVTSGGASCGGSTITQQLIKQTALTNERKVKRKVKEVILALQIERERSKDEILEMYLRIAPEGSNIYGVTTAARFYFGKELNQLSLAEMAILASIPQDPNRLSPTKAANPKDAQERVKARQMYVLDQMEKYMDQINNSIKEESGKENALTQEKIDRARKKVLVYREPRYDIEAPHFVVYARNLLQERGYNKGEPFTLTELETGGYKIYTTVDLDIQRIAEEQVKKGVDDYGKKYGGYNAALVALNPKNGEVLAMAGSYDFFGTAYPEGCTSGDNCKFEGQVNIVNTNQSPGSSMKPMVYYMAMMDGLISPGSIIADVPIKIGPYDPKNYEGGFIGMASARKMLSDSRNIPAIYLVNTIGVGRYIEEMQKWGYTTINNPAGYGPAVAVGGLDIKLIEHAQAYTVFANEGKLTQHEVITKIVDGNGEVIYEAKPESKQVADPRGVYLVNDILNANNRGPGVTWDGRDIAGKTGTSEEQRETLFATYTPEIVAVGWLGNNDNTGMRYGAGGFTTARPWISEFVKRIGGSFPPTKFVRPGGIVVGGVCRTEEGSDACGEFNGDLAIADISVPSYVRIQSAVVCTDQQDRLARDIDITLGFSITKIFKRYRMVDKSLQGFLDEWFSKKGENNQALPTEYCDINRNPSGTMDPWASIISPKTSQPLGDKLEVNVNAFSPNGDITKVEVYYDGDFLGESTTLPYIDTFDIGAQSPGAHTFQVKVTDSTGAVGTTSITLEALGTISVTAPATATQGSTVDVGYSYSGSSLSNVKLYQDDTLVATCSAGICEWVVPSTPGSVTLVVKGKHKGVEIESNPVTVVVV